MRQQVPVKASHRSKQTGSILVVAMISILSVAAIAAGTNAVLTQSTVTANEKTRALQGMSVADSLRLQSARGPNVLKDLSANLYGNFGSFTADAKKDKDAEFFDGIVEVGTRQYGYSIRSGLQTVNTKSDLKSAAPNIETVCQLPDNQKLGDSIDLTCNLDNVDVTIQDPWRIKNLTKEIKLEFMLKNSSLEFIDDFEVYGEKVEIFLKDSKNSPIDFRGAFAAVADTDQAYVELKSLQNRSATFEDGMIVAGKKAELMLEDLKNTDLSVGGPLVVDGRDDESRVEIKNLRNRTFDVAGPVYIAGEKSELIINDQKNTAITFSDRVIVDGGSSSSYTEIKSIENKAIAFEGGVTAQGKKPEIRIEELKNSNLSFGDAVKVVSTSRPNDEAILTIKSLTNKAVEFKGPVLLDGGKASFTFEGLNNARASIGGHTHIFASMGESLFQIKGLKNKSTKAKDDFFITGAPAEFKFENLKNSDVRFNTRVYVAPNQLSTQAKGKNGSLSVGGLSKYTEYESSNTCNDFGSVICTTTANNRAAIDNAHANVAAPSLSAIKKEIGYAAADGESGGEIKRRAVQ